MAEVGRNLTATNASAAAVLAAAESSWAANLRDVNTTLAGAVEAVANAAYISARQHTADVATLRAIVAANVTALAAAADEAATSLNASVAAVYSASENWAAALSASLLETDEDWRADNVAINTTIAALVETVAGHNASAAAVLAAQEETLTALAGAVGVLGNETVAGLAQGLTALRDDVQSLAVRGHNGSLLLAPADAGHSFPIAPPVPPSPLSSPLLSLLAVCR